MGSPFYSSLRPLSGPCHHGTVNNRQSGMG